MTSQRSGEGVVRGRKTATITDRDVRDGGRREGDRKALNNSKDNVADEDAIQEEKEKESVILSPLQRGEGSGVGANRRHPIHPSPSHPAPTISMKRPENPNSTIATKLKSDDTRTSNTSLDTFMDKDNSSENNSAARLLLFRSVRFVLLGLPG